MTQMMMNERTGLGVSICPEEIGALLEKEWLLTNSRGSYASGTVLGCNTRRYHGYLIASLRPPVERVVTVSNLLETVQRGGQRYEISNFEFSDRLHPQGYRFLKQFHQQDGVHFEFELGDQMLRKSIYLSYEQDLVMVSYEFSGSDEETELDVMPMVALRDFHSLQSSSSPMEAELEDSVVTVHTLDPHGPAVHLYMPEGQFHRGTDWWYAIRYRQEQRRGQHDYEDVWVPGSFRVKFRGEKRLVLVMQATAGWERHGLMDLDLDSLIEDLRRRRRSLVEQAQVRDEYEESLVKAADRFIVRRQIQQQGESASILAGYPWFADWGRDTFISLPGLLLCTRRFAEAREVLSTFGAYLDGGQIPNRFDDYGGPPHYNSIDASLWFVHAAYEYQRISGDRATFDREYWPMLEQIVGSYHSGTRDGIHADADGLIMGGDANTQLTWMDAKCNGVAFTPRYGKPVEVNALWIHALRVLAQTGATEEIRRKYEIRAEKAEESFLRLFWNEKNGYLNDCVYPDGGVDAGVRPNQIFAVSLPHSCLSEDRQRSVVNTVQEHLLTPYGLRSISPRDSRYRGHYQGDQFQRDSAYHQGTVWSYLIGPFVEAYLKVNRFSAESRQQARAFLDPLLRHMEEDACLGSISEIFDGDWPHRPQGCVAQAWSVGELLRCKKLIDTE